MRENTRGTLVTSDGQTLSYCHLIRSHPNVIIIAHGFYTSKQSVILQGLARLLSLRYDVFMFDFRGHGRSSGVFTWMSKEGEDLKAVLEFVKPRYKRIGIIGFSLGGSISVNVLSRYPEADSLICVGSPSAFRTIDFHIWELDWGNDIFYSLLTKEGRKGRGIRPGPLWLKKDEPIKRVPRLTMPVMYVHGEKDWVVKPWHSRKMYALTNSKKRIAVIKGGSHAEYLLREPFKKQVSGLIMEWFRETL